VTKSVSPFFCSPKRTVAARTGLKHLLENEANSELSKRESLMVQSPSGWQYQRDVNSETKCETLKLGLLATATGVVSDLGKSCSNRCKAIYYRRTSVMVRRPTAPIANNSSSNATPDSASSVSDEPPLGNAQAYWQSR